jgi:rod shape-determining protein MreB
MDEKVGVVITGAWREKLGRWWRSAFPSLSLTATQKLAVDLGTANARLYCPGEGIVVNEPSVIVLGTERPRVVAVGQAAKTLSICHPPGTRVVRPIRDGVIADCEAAGQLLSQFINRAIGSRHAAGLELLICIPADLTPLELAAYEDLAGRAGADKVTLVEEPYAAAVGAGHNPRAAQTSMAVDLGAGSTDIAVVSGGSLLYASTRRVGGDEIDLAITRYLQLERKLEVTAEAADEIKIRLAGLEVCSDEQSMAVRGKNLTTGLPEEIIVASKEIEPLIQPTLRVIKQHLRTALEEIPTGVSVDLLDSGIILSGGLSQLPGLSGHLNREFGLSIQVTHNPMLAAVLGAGSLLELDDHSSLRETIEARAAVRGDVS